MKKLPIMQTPCNNCPFRKDSLKGWLGSERMTEISESETETEPEISSESENEQ